MIAERIRCSPPLHEIKKTTPRTVAAALVRCSNEWIFLVDYVDGFFDVVMSPVDVVQGALLQTLSKAVVFVFGNVMVRLVEQFQGAMETAAPIHVSVNRRMIVQVFVIVDGGSFDLRNGCVNFLDGFAFLFLAFPAAGTLQMSSGVAKLGQSMQIGRMVAPGRRGCRHVRRDKKQHGKHGECEFC